MTGRRPPRRIVTGHDEAGRSVVLSDAPAPVSRDLDAEGVTFHEVWRTAASPAPIARSEPEPTERAVRVGPDPGGSALRVIDFRPGHLRAGLQSPMHRTESVDYGIVLEGEMVLVLADREVALRAGDIVIQRGTDHAWANRSQRDARMAFILVDGRFADELHAVLGPLARETGLDATDEALR